MVSTRSRERQGQHADSSAQVQQQQPEGSTVSKANIPTAVEQEQQRQADRAMIEVYKQQWQASKGVSQTAFRHVRDVFWWMEHVCGVNMLDYEEKVIVCCLFSAVLVLILLGAYKQSTQLVQLLKQMLFPGSK